jgi:hypothetical protein
MKVSVRAHPSGTKLDRMIQVTLPTASILPIEASSANTRVNLNMNLRNSANSLSSISH